MSEPDKAQKKRSPYDVGGSIAVSLVAVIILIIVVITLVQGGTVSFSGGIIGFFFAVGLIYLLGGVTGWVVHTLWKAIVLLWKAIVLLWRSVTRLR